MAFIKLPRINLIDESEAISPTVRALRLFIKTLLSSKLWSIDDSRPRKREIVLVSTIEDLRPYADSKNMEIISFIESTLNALISKVSDREPFWKPVLEHRSPRDDRNDDFNLAVANSIERYCKSVA